MATVSTGFGAILLAVQQQVRAQIACLSLNPSLCVVVARDIAPALAADQDVLIRAGSVISQRTDHSTGRTCLRLKRFLLVYPRTRYAVDESVSDEQAVTDTTYGMVPWEEQVTNAVQMFWPARAAGGAIDFLTCDPIHIADGTDPLKGNDKMWGTSCVTFEVDYLQTIHETEWNPPLITTDSIASGQTGSAYSQTVSAVGGATPYVWSSLGNLPTGLAISSTGTISGTPSNSGTYYFTVVVTDANGQRGVKWYTVRLALAITPTTLPDGTVGDPYSQQLTATGGVGAVTFSLASGSLPPGVTLTAGGLLAGTP